MCLDLFETLVITPFERLDRENMRVYSQSYIVGDGFISLDQKRKKGKGRAGCCGGVPL